VNWLQKFGEQLVQWRRLLASALLVSFAAAMFAHALLGDNGWIKYRQKKAEYQRLQQDVQRVTEDNKKLDSEIKALKSDPKAIEKEAREQLRYAKPGEVIYLLPEKAGPQPSQPPESAKK
jgi:cell division protein FtsB